MVVEAPGLFSDTVAQARGMLNTLTADSPQGKALTFLDTHETFFSPTGAGVPNMEDYLGFDVKPLPRVGAQPS